MKQIINKPVRVISMCLLILLWSLPLLAAQPAMSHPPRITIDDVQQIEKNGERILFIDTRTAPQWNRADKKLPGAVRLANQRDIRELTKTYPADTPIVTYCT
mgnify:CR=1 FL=1